MSSTRLNFTIDAEAEQSSARACTFKTLHNEVQTPVFMPVATFAALRTQDTESVRTLNFPVLLANTYHLFLRPGPEVFKHIGGIHTFMNWKNSVLTDSGGYQIFSLSKSFSISEQGASFKSYVDGKDYLLSPESSIETQKIIGSDIMMALDQCISSRSDHEDSRKAVDLTARWAERSLAARGDSSQSIFGIVQGACFSDLRKISASQITSLPFDGFAIGGLAVGESDPERKDMTELTASLLPKNLPRYLMGVGTPMDLLEAVHRGIDMFDCIIPTSLAQQGNAYTSHGKIELRRSVYKFADVPLDENCGCNACRNYSRAYLHHLIKTNEYFGANLIGQHNLAFYNSLVKNMREHIIKGDFVSFYGSEREKLLIQDQDNPKTPPKKKYRKNTMSMGNFEVVHNPKGFSSIRDIACGEIMHSVNNPVDESLHLYVEQTHLPESLALDTEEEFVIWDVGLGAGTNAMTAIIECENIRETHGSKRPLHIISFETNTDSFKLAMQNPSLFSHIRHAAPKTLLNEGIWSDDKMKIKWSLLNGDFIQLYPESEKPDVIYYDMYSLNTNEILWDENLFENILEFCKPKNTSLITYSVSTQIRTALLAAGFYVGYGTGTGPKAETTIAFSSKEAAGNTRLLGAEWLERWNRSTAQTSAGISSEEKERILDRVRKHPQFN